MELDAKIYVAGHSGLVGSALVRVLRSRGYTNLLLRTHAELDLVDGARVAQFFADELPEYVFIAAARVGGIWANSHYPAAFIYENLQIQTNLIHQAYLHDVCQLAYIGSSCIYPRKAPQPITEDSLLSGPLEETNEPYAVAKIAGLKMCQAYNSQYGTHFLVPVAANLYGIGDNFHPKDSHVIPALMRRIHEAEVSGHAEVSIWGSGNPRREFLFADDFADACIFLMEKYSENSPINVGSGYGLSIKELAEAICRVVGYEGRLVFDATKPDGMPLKQLDSSRMKLLGWQNSVPLQKGLEKTYRWFREIHLSNPR